MRGVTGHLSEVPGPPPSRVFPVGGSLKGHVSTLKSFQRRTSTLKPFQRRCISSTATGHVSRGTSGAPSDPDSGPDSAAGRPEVLVGSVTRHTGEVTVLGHRSAVVRLPAAWQGLTRRRGFETQWQRQPHSGLTETSVSSLYSCRVLLVVPVLWVVPER